MILSHHFLNDTFQVIIFLKSTIHLILPGWAVSSTGRWLIERIVRFNFFTAGSQRNLQRSGSAVGGWAPTPPRRRWRQRLKLWESGNQLPGLCPTVRPSLTVYVKKLQEHVPVDIFGGCGRALNCNKGRDECFVEIARSYQFYLSFENSLCKDYATEKLFRALASDLVPVVMGGANYSKIVPPKSIINVQDFPSPEVLGKELMRLVEVRSVFLWQGVL